MTLHDAHLAMLGLRVLVVDDDADIRRDIVSSLEAAGCAVASTDSGAKALSLLQAATPTDHARPFDLVVSDIGMPGMSGLELLSAIKRVAGSLPVVLVTAYCNDQTRQVSLRLGAVAVLDKPLNFKRLREIVFAAARRSGE